MVVVAGLLLIWGDGVYKDSQDGVSDGVLDILPESALKDIRDLR